MNSMRTKHITFIRVLIEAAESVDLVIIAIRHRSIDQAGWHMALRLADARAVIRAATATTTETRGHEECGRRSLRGGGGGIHRIRSPGRPGPTRWVSVERRKGRRSVTIPGGSGGR
jgi:hypothetical protein